MNKTEEITEKANDNKFNKFKSITKVVIALLLLFMLANIAAFLVNTYIMIVEYYEPKEFVEAVKVLINQGFGLGDIKNVFMQRFDMKVYNIFKLLFIALFYLIYYFKKINKSLVEAFYKYRYRICLILFLICIIFSFNGSAIGFFYDYTENGIDEGLIFGVNRKIRSDEFSVNTPIAFSQVETGFKWTNDSFRGTDSNMFIIYGQPVLDISMIFRLTQIGYLLFGADRGLSFFWCIRLIGLFLATIEFGMFITNKNKKLSLSLAILMAFSPVIQWWFAINGLVEMIIAAELGLILFKKFLIEKTTLKKCLSFVGLMICIGTYIFVFYPAWMVPIFYMFVPIVIWTIIDNKKDITFNKKQIAYVILIGLIFILLFARILVNSQDAISAVLNTVYPGDRISVGGGENIGRHYLRQNFNIFMQTPSEIENECEKVMFYDFMYVTLFLVCYIYIVKKYFKDKLLNLLVIFDLILNLYILVGFPEVIAKITLMSYTTTVRILHVIGIINLFILFRILSSGELKEKLNFKNITSILISLIITIIISILLHVYYGEFFNIIRLIIISIVNFIVFFIVLKRNYNALIVMSILLAFFGGMFVNPLRIGSNNITKIPMFEELVEIDNKDSGIWIVDGSFSRIQPNLLAMYGLKVINTTNVYPDVEKWKSIDVDNKYEDVYNRYAHILLTVDTSLEKAKFDLLSMDSFAVSLTEENIKTLKIKYVVLDKDSPIYDFKDVKTEKVFSNEKIEVYKLIY